MAPSTMGLRPIKAMPAVIDWKLIGSRLGGTRSIRMSDTRMAATTNSAPHRM
jgi:hypothetical protein